MKDDAALTVCVCMCDVCYLTAYYHADCRLEYSSAALSVSHAHTQRDMNMHVKSQTHRESDKHKHTHNQPGRIYKACIVRRRFWMKICLI